MLLDPALLVRVAAESSHSKHVELQEMGEVNDPLIWQIGLALMEESQTAEPMGNCMLSRWRTLCFHLLKNYTVNGHPAPGFVGGLSGRKLRRATEFINANLSDDVTLAEIAETVELSPYHFSLTFKRDYRIDSTAIFNAAQSRACQTITHQRQTAYC